MKPALDMDKLAEKARPFYGLPIWRWASFRLAWWTISILDFIWWRSRARGQEGLPRDGSYLLLPNHATGLDPWLLSVALWRPLSFMASAQSLTHPIFGSMLKAMGAFPKVKYVKDKSSMKAMTDLYDNGQVVTIFPEGRRSWDGHLLKIHPGIGRTIKRMKARVVFCRMPANTFLQPRWAKYPRWVPIDCEYVGPLTYPDELSAEEITADVERRLQITPRLRSGARTWMFRPAEGLTDFLWACPRCKVTESLKVAGRKRDQIRCSACGAGWRLDVESRLHPLDGGPSTTVRAAFQTLDAHFGPRPVQDAAHFEEAGVTLREAAARVRMVPRGGRLRLIAEGPLQLTETRVQLLAEDGETEVWGVDLAELVAVSVELGGRLQIRSKDALYQLGFPDASFLKWGHFIKRWRFPDDPEPVG